MYNKKLPGKIVKNLLGVSKQKRKEIYKKKLIGGISVIREKLSTNGEYGVLSPVDEERSMTDTAGKHLTGAQWEFGPDTKIILEKTKKKRK